MKKTVGLGCLLFVLIGVLFVLNYNETRLIKFIEGKDGELCISVYFDSGRETIKPWYCEADGILYYFLPSYVKETEIWCGDLKKEITVDGKSVRGNFLFESDSLYTIAYMKKTNIVSFCELSDLSTIFIETESGNMDYIHEDKEHEEKGRIVSLDSDGNIEYHGKMEHISGRGNQTWWCDKKPYHIKLESPGEPGGLTASQYFNLLALVYDTDKIHSKLVFDLAEVLDAEYVCGCTWVNLYLNGEWSGMYLLTRVVSDWEEFNLGQGEFVVEKELPGRYAEEQYFITEHGSPFVVVRPKEVSERRLEEISKIIQDVEDAIEREEIEGVIDIDSFATQFLIDEISLNYDAFITSAYIHKKAEDEKIYAGPAWDYDNAFGKRIVGEPWWTNPDVTVLTDSNGLRGCPPYYLDWYRMLYDNDAFYDCVTRKYEQKLPELEILFTSTIDEYAELIADSVRSDSIRWNWNYQGWNNKIRYLKRFCCKRLETLSSRWQVKQPQIEWRPSQETHQVIFKVDGTEVFSITVSDGDIVDVTEFEELARYSDGDWVIWDGYNYEIFNENIPVLEDWILEFRVSE